MPFIFVEQLGLRNACDLFDLVDRQYGVFRSAKLTLLELLKFTRARRTTDGRDHVYGLLGLYQSTGGRRSLSDLLLPDYKKPLAAVLRDATRYAIEERRDLEVFNEVEEQRLHTSQDEALPSWVPQWYMDGDIRIEPYMLLNCFSADDNAIYDTAHHTLEDPDCLSLAGILVDPVLNVATVATADIFNKPHGITSLLEEVQTSMEGNMAQGDANILGKTLSAGANADRQPATEVECADYVVWSQYLEREGRLPPMARDLLSSHEEYDDSIRRAARYSEAIYYSWRNRRFFVTVSGFIGLGPRRMEAEDTIAVLSGSRWPVILRSHGEYYELLGTCYVHGIMDSEAVRKHRAEGKENHVFVIR